MHVMVAPDSFKGSVSALGVANAMERGILSVFPDAQITKVPIADGGEGTVEALIAATGGQILYEDVTGPLGEPLRAYWGILGDGKTTVIEAAAASGLPLVPINKRDPRITTTYGTGLLINAALDRGLRKFIIGIGGSATNDGGVGVAKALGAKFLDENGEELPNGGAALSKLRRVDLSGLDPRLAETEIVVACDVDNPLCGPRGASAIFGPQKGATPQMIVELDAALENYSNILEATVGKDVSNNPGAGAAGGLGAGLMFFSSATLRPGVGIVLEATNFSSLVEKTDLVITGEGMTDLSTAYGKAPVGIAKVAKQFNIPVICISGGLGNEANDVLLKGIDGLMSIVPKPMLLEDCMTHGVELIADSTARTLQLIKVGMSLSI